MGQISSGIGAVGDVSTATGQMADMFAGNPAMAMLNQPQPQPKLAILLI